jgi:signal peptidase II
LKGLQKANKILLVTTLVFFLLDRISKELVRNTKPIHFKYLSINYLTNTGSAFGFFKGNNLFFILLTLVVLLMIYHYRADFLQNKTKTAFTGLIIAGALGNLYDRLIYGAVIDFLDFHFWPVFNIADSCISLGIIFLLLSLKK